jgi:hypothetical protein
MEVAVDTRCSGDEDFGLKRESLPALILDSLFPVLGNLEPELGDSRRNNNGALCLEAVPERGVVAGSGERVADLGGIVRKRS